MRSYLDRASFGILNMKRVVRTKQHLIQSGNCIILISISVIFIATIISFSIYIKIYADGCHIRMLRTFYKYS